jgi:two-component sensor histidine kinase
MNAAKYAFPARSVGTVGLRLSVKGAGLSCAMVDDRMGSRGTAVRLEPRGMILSEVLAQRAGGNCAWMFGQHGTEV